MSTVVLTRRTLLAAGGPLLVTGAAARLLPARAEGLQPTESMAGGANSFRLSVSPCYFRQVLDIVYANSAVEDPISDAVEVAGCGLTS